MKNKTRIISISGNPVSGKSTVIKQILEKLKSKGFSDENIHWVSTGNLFREYFNKIMKLIENIDNEEILKEFSEDVNMKKVLSNSIYRKKIQEECILLKKSGADVKKFDIANANNSKELASVRHIIDNIIDTEIVELGKRILEENNQKEVWLIDSRLAFHNIPESFSVRLTVKDSVAAKRLIKDSSRGKEDNNYKDLEEAQKKVTERKHGEQERYKRKYNIDLEDTNNYNLIIDTSYSDVDEIADVILNCEECNRTGKKYGKTWASPKIFLPLQRISDTAGCGLGSNLNFEQMVESIKQNGYKPDKEIEVIYVNDKYYIIEGHHRNFASAYIGKTLIPYTKSIMISENEAKIRAKSLKLSYLYDYEETFKDKNEKMNFRYTDIYPDIYEQVKHYENLEQFEI